MDCKIEPGTARLTITPHPPTVKVIHNFALQHLKAATIFRDHVVKFEAENAGKEWGSFCEEIRSYVSACILSATAALEALINELFIAHNCRLRNLFTDFEKEFWGPRGIERKTILYKYQLALEMLGKPRLDERASPYRDAWALIELRHALVHFKPTWDPARQRVVELEEVLSDKFALSPFPVGGADFVTMKCMSAGCSNWVITTALALINEFDSRTHLDDNKMVGFKKLQA